MTVSPSISLRCVLERHSKSISSLRVHPDGHILLSGADDGLIILWNLDTGELLQEISCVYNGPITAVCWIPAARGSTRAFAFGCSDGSVQVYAITPDEASYHPVSFQRVHSGPIEDIAFNTTYRRLASVGNGSLQVWVMNDDYSIKEHHLPIPRKPFITRSVCFCDRGEVTLVFFLESHEIIAYTLEPFGVKWVTEISTRNGYATFSEDQQSILVSNLVTGIDSYAVSGVSPGVPPVLQQSFRHSISHNVPLQITSALYGSWVISGSDDGSVRIFDQRSGELLKSLRHADVGTLVQVVASHSEGETCLIVSGSSSPGPSVIKVWCHKSVQPQDPMPDTKVPHHGHTWNTSQICAIVIFVSIVVNFAMPYMPLLMKHMYAWVLQMLIAWGHANGVHIEHDQAGEYDDMNLTDSL